MAAVWTRINTVILLLVLFALLALIGMVASGVRGGPLDPADPPASTDSVKLPGTPISGQTTISTPGHYYLTRDISITGAQTAITITADDVSLDLGGFTVDGSDTAGSIGIALAFSRARITVSNGTIKDFHVGLDAIDDRHLTVDGVRAVSNVRGMQVNTLSLVSDCVAWENTETGIYVAFTAVNTSIRNCVVQSNVLDGIGFAGEEGVVEGSVVLSNLGTDIRVLSTASQVMIRDNLTDRMMVEAQADSTIIYDNTCAFGLVTNNGTNTYVAGPTEPHGNVGCAN
jgi:hypothetical protein